MASRTIGYPEGYCCIYCHERGRLEMMHRVQTKRRTAYYFHIDCYMWENEKLKKKREEAKRRNLNVI